MGAGGKRGFDKEKRGSSGVKAALLMLLHGSPKKSVAPHKLSSTKTPQAPEVEKYQPGLYIMEL